MILHDIQDDVKCIKGNNVKVFLLNRGFQALFIYRLSNLLWRKKVPIIPLVLTRFIQIVYSIDIDWKCSIEGGCRIIHGVGLVIGAGVRIRKGAVLYHGVTLGISHGTKRGFPELEENVLVGCGAKILGPIKIGKSSKIGANSVVTHDVPENSIVAGIPGRVISKNITEEPSEEVILN